MSDAAPTVKVTVEEGVATVLLSDLRRKNAMSPALGDALRDAVERLRGDLRVRAVVLSGEGDAFSAGGDLKMLEALREESREGSRDFMLGFYARYLSVLALEVPVVAAVQGAAIGAGLCVAMACDLLVVDEDAKLALNFVQLGLHPGMGATLLTPHRVGAQRAAELLLTGRRFNGREAVEMGMALEATPSGNALLRAEALARQMAAQAPLAVRALVRALRVDRHALQRALEYEAMAQSESYASHDLGEGLAAAAARRAPAFVGR
ncbi:MAG: enoyl-CoA hydratase/isomerase family protein [Myxococcales bacterium]|nr:enoyl-CoA hydratase/isomerase family protein [Myxococcales bacterium]